MSTKTAEHVIRARETHHAALKSMLPPNSKASGLQVWRKLRQIEQRADSATTRYCNGEMSLEQLDVIIDAVTVAVGKVFSGVPKGFFVNRDPRGYALKLEAGSVPFPLHEDWGRYQILAPEIN